MPVRLSDIPRDEVSVAKKASAKRMEIRYSKPASIMYIFLLVLYRSLFISSPRFILTTFQPRVKGILN